MLDAVSLDKTACGVWPLERTSDDIVTFLPSLLSDDGTVTVTSKTVHTEIGSEESGGGGGGSDTGLIVGIAVIGGLFALTLFGIAGFAIYKRRK